MPLKNTFIVLQREKFLRKSSEKEKNVGVNITLGNESKCIYNLYCFCFCRTSNIKLDKIMKELDEEVLFSLLSIFCPLRNDHF